MRFCSWTALFSVRPEDNLLMSAVGVGFASFEKILNFINSSIGEYNYLITHIRRTSSTILLYTFSWGLTTK